ncbi:hypothetical protein [Mycobacterium sp. 1274761.0]|uniref:hypothetical protein n=1 Tax=Mycobacterium sp. 1274761.0 TaxID=1834077 RepID=UPI0007FFD4A9|nr:hypothetical protein [Mycobacterium sp. 1274761.0]OBK71140.1 hypothetical protein A5651_01020 [Mycobacterium sp. 1274761.0]
MSDPVIKAEINRKIVSRDQVLAWEDSRIAVVARKLGASVPSGSLATRREVLLRSKLDLGPDEISNRLSRQTRLAEVIARAGAGVSHRRRISAINLSVKGGTAEQFVEAFETWSETSDELVLLRACPDHFVIRTCADGRQEVLERTGGSPLPSFFFIDYQNVSSLVTPAEPEFPHQIAGVATTSDGAAIGGVRHQFRDTSDGFRARLTVELPLPTLGRMVAGHRWHLACEFSNWIEAAFG